MVLLERAHHIKETTTQKNPSSTVHHTVTLGRLTHSLNFHFLGVTSWGFLYKDAEMELGLQGIYEESVPADRGGGGRRDGQRERLNCNQVSAKPPWGSLQQTCSVRVGSCWLGCSSLYPPAWAHHLCRQPRMYVTLKKRLTAGGSLLTALPPTGETSLSFNEDLAVHLCAHYTCL